MSNICTEIKTEVLQAIQKTTTIMQRTLNKVDVFIVVRGPLFLHTDNGIVLKARASDVCQNIPALRKLLGDAPQRVSCEMMLVSSFGSNCVGMTWTHSAHDCVTGCLTNQERQTLLGFCSDAGA